MSVFYWGNALMPHDGSTSFLNFRNKKQDGKTPYFKLQKRISQSEGNSFKFQLAPLASTYDRYCSFKVAIVLTIQQLHKKIIEKFRQESSNLFWHGQISNTGINQLFLDTGTVPEVRVLVYCAGYEAGHPRVVPEYEGKGGGEGGGRLHRRKPNLTWANRTNFNLKLRGIQHSRQKKVFNYRYLYRLLNL